MIEFKAASISVLFFFFFFDHLTIHVLAQMTYFMIIRPVSNLDPEEEDWCHVILFLFYSYSPHVSASVSVQ